MTAVGERARGGSAWTIVEYNLVASRRYWRPYVIGGIAMPVLTAVSLGVGLGHIVHSGRLGVPYFQFVAPALLAATALMSAVNEATFPITAGFLWVRQFHGMAATPLTPRQICNGTILWLTLRVGVSSSAYLAIIACFGGARRAATVLAVPIATFAAVAFAAPVLALSASLLTHSNAFNILQRFVVMPMFLFSGTFYPVTQLPEWGRWLAYATPLWHGNELARATSLGHLSLASALGHVAYLLAWLVPGILLAHRRFAWRLGR
jgi:lipooligosaccharide transport system permease protein